MKKYILTLLLLIGIGGVLAYFTIQQNLQLDEEVYLKTTASIRNLKLIDSNINILLFKIRHENQSNYDELEQLGFDINDEFDNLRFEALFEEIEKSPALNEATIAFEQQLTDKQEKIALFIQHNQSLMQANDDFLSSSATNAPINQLVKKLSLEKEVNALNINFYRFLEDNSPNNKQALNDDIAYIGNAIESVNEDDQGIVYGYIKTLSDNILSLEETQQYFTEAINQGTASSLNDLESAYVDFHNLAIEKANNLRSALIIYGFILLIALLVFAYLLWKQYQSLEQQVADRTEEIAQAYDDLKESQEQLIQSEKMASLGEMVAGVAHEINTPLGYVNSNVGTVKLNLQDLGGLLGGLSHIYREAKSPKKDRKKISQLLVATLKDYSQLQKDEVYKESLQLLDDSDHGLSEISNLVMSLKDFSRLDRQSTDEINIHRCIENALKIASNPIKENNIIIKKMFDDLPNIVCIPSKLNQLFLNIITNAAQAMKDNGGELSIQTQRKNDTVVISFMDQGVGMDEATTHKMFDPFFTSKPIGEGTGLGMSIAYKIVQVHNGKIQVTSKLGVGTTIAVQLPINYLAS